MYLRVFKLYRELSKGGIVTLVLISVLGGYLCGHIMGEDLNWQRMMLTLLSVFFLASGSSAWNQLQERKIDARMPRTAGRPLPSGRISVLHAAAFVITTCLLGLGILWMLDFRLCLLGVLAIASYNGLYTLWWKRKLAFGAIPGALPGALPIWMGYVSARRDLLAPGGLYLFGLLFFWQMPHFWSLAIRYREDYRQGGIPTLPVAKGDGFTVFQITLWCLGYVGLALAAPLFLGTRWVYFTLTAIVSTLVLWELVKFLRHSREPESLQKKWLPFFLWVNLSLVVYVGAAALDLWIDFYGWLKPVPTVTVPRSY